MKRILILAVTLCCLAGCALCTRNGDAQHPTIHRIQECSTLQVGTTGDYRPLSYLEADGEYWGFGIEMAGKIAERMKVGIAFVPTSWPTLTADVISDPQKPESR